MAARDLLPAMGIEGIKNKIKVLKRMAYGYRDDDYFFLKIMDAFPGLTDEPNLYTDFRPLSKRPLCR